MGRERRKFARIGKRFKVRYGEKAFEHAGVTTDISVGGIFLVGPLIELGNRIHIHIETAQGDFYVEGMIMRRKQVPANLRRVEPQGMGVRFLNPAEVVAQLIPARQRAVATRTLNCTSTMQLKNIIQNELQHGVLVVPVGEPPPAIQSMVEFTVQLTFLDPPKGAMGMGRVVQILETTNPSAQGKSAVIEVQEAQQLLATLQRAL